MTFLTRLSLILLRVAIGWHFLFEGLEKVDSYLRGPAEGKTVWTSQHYLRESSGPLRGVFRAQAGDLNEAALERLTVLPGQPPALPAALEKDWKDTFDRFVAFYGVGDAKSAWKTVPPEFVRVLVPAPQGCFPADAPWPALAGLKPVEQLAAAALEQAKAEALLWLLQGERETTRSFSQITEKVKETTAERIKAYRAKLAQLSDIEKYGLHAFGKDVWNKKLTALKDEIGKTRRELLAELNRPLEEALTFAFKYRLTKEQQAQGPLPPAQVKGLLFWIDQVTMWGVTAVGACLLLGLYTRTACVGGAGFLLMVYLAMPALPWLPVNPRAEGHYFYVNKNIVEMLALLALATTPSGRWAGLDGLIYALNPWRRFGRQGDRQTGREQPSAVALSPGFPGSVPPSPVKESPHVP